MGVLSHDGKCKTFDAKCDGFVRSDAACALFIQRARDARRSYCRVVHIKSTNDGFKEQGITHPSGKCQLQLFEEFYQECDIKPSDLTYLEAHGTGTIAGDHAELYSIEKGFGKKRRIALPFGAVKTNCGHSEGSSGIISLTKIIISMETGFIPPNLHYDIGNRELDGVQVLTETMAIEGDRCLIGLNGFGFGGSTCHMLVERNEKQKAKPSAIEDDLPRLVCVSGRTDEAISTIFDDLKLREFDVEFVNLLQQIFTRDVKGHYVRGYTILSKENGEIKRSQRRLTSNLSPLYLVFSDFDGPVHKIAQELHEIPIFAESLQRVHNIMISEGINGNELMLRGQSPNFSPRVVQTITSAAIQIGIADVLRAMKLTIEGYSGYGIGEFVCGYLDGALDLEETVLSIICAANILSAVAAHAALFEEKPNNSEVRVGKLDSAKPDLRNLVKTILIKIGSKSRAVTSKWLSVFPNKSINVDYFVEVLRNNDLNKDACDSFKCNGVIIEAGSHKFRAPSKKLPTLTVNSCSTASSVTVLLDILGRLYEYGHNPEICELYPRVQYPVGRGTPMISPLIKWDHSKNWFVPFCKLHNDETADNGHSYTISLEDEQWSFIADHKTNGHILFPAAGYVVLVWKSLAAAENVATIYDLPVVFEDVKFMRSTLFSDDKEVHLTVLVKKGGGSFKILEGEITIVTGQVYIPNEPSNEFLNLPVPEPRFCQKNLPMKKEDLYKELRLRGYQYGSAFRRIVQCDINGQCAKILWDKTEAATRNFTLFLDNMLQLMVFVNFERLNVLSTEIGRLSIDPKYHVTYAESLSERQELPAYFYTDCNVVKSGGVEARSVQFRSVAGRKPRADEPLLETYSFIPNRAQLSTAKSVRVNMQIVWENLLEKAARIVELVDEATDKVSSLLSPLMHEAFEDMQFIQADLTILTKQELQKPFGVNIETTDLIHQRDCTLIVGTKLLERPMILRQALHSLKEQGFLLTRESMDFCPDEEKLCEFVIVTVHETPVEKLILLRVNTLREVAAVVDVSEGETENFQWIPVLQHALSENPNVIVYSQNDSFGGVLGFVNCLRYEPELSTARGVFIQDEAPPFYTTHPFYSEQLKKNMAINVYKNSQWGTYRHLRLGSPTATESQHAYVNATNYGDLSTLKWIQGNLSAERGMNDHKLIHLMITIVKDGDESNQLGLMAGERVGWLMVYYTGLNFRDIVLASGMIPVDAFNKERLDQECPLGIEFSGRLSSGKRVFGARIKGKALSTLVESDTPFLWTVPPNWSLEDAATVPTIYATLVYAFYIRCPFKRGQSILIQAGSGGIGFAAITLAIREGLTVYATVSSQEKREFLKRHFPQILDEHIGNSRDTTFQQMVMIQTQGRGVDIVLNSLSGELLRASVSCLAEGGIFLEIGKYDMIKNNELKLVLLKRQASFLGIMLDVFDLAEPYSKNILLNKMQELLDDGTIRPLPRTVFREDEVENAFRFMASGKHVGKVLVALREEEKEKLVAPAAKTIKALPRFRCYEDKVYVLVGGLGGFGLELADWLILRGARKIVLCSRSGITTGYQTYRLKTWAEYGANVHISTSNVTTGEGCEELLKESSSLGEVTAIFNLALVPRDATFENQTPETFRVCFAPKAMATRNLDSISRRLCKNLRDFVVFSSTICGRGNAGQTNYGMANCTMERICEERKLVGLPAVAIQWGPISDVGFLAMSEIDSEIEIVGTRQQKISSCLEVLDILLNQNNAIVSSVLIAKKTSGLRDLDNIADVVAHILGINDLSTISQYVTLAELGLDSITKHAVTQSLKRYFNVQLSNNEIMQLTFAKLSVFQGENRLVENQTSVKSVIKDGDLSANNLLALVEHQEKSHTQESVTKNVAKDLREDTLIHWRS